MVVRMKAIYRDGVFVPQVACELAANSQVDLTVELVTIEPPLSASTEERSRLRSEFVADLKSRTLPADAPRKFSRDELHERR